eukprot:TRINITY_DN66271_c6_g15_i1.p1 TRINITY_DN66271_c6_g15~~TRINITY_DN66271_c6_g15_i1.p1  ORF type:complete len:336 (-),score=23.10 TRINITY_DN66271_c6_g15_i1:268-1239(-)
MADPEVQLKKEEECISAEFPGSLLKVMINLPNGTTTHRIMSKSTCNFQVWQQVYEHLRKLWYSEPLNMNADEASDGPLEVYFKEDGDILEITDTASYDDFVVLIAESCGEGAETPKIELKMTTSDRPVTAISTWSILDVPEERKSATLRKRAWSVGSTDSIAAMIAEADETATPHQPTKRRRQEEPDARDSHHQSSSDHHGGGGGGYQQTQGGQQGNCKGPTSKAQVYVSGLDPTAQESDVRRLFAEYKDCIVAIYKKERFAFVHMNTLAAASDAINKLSGSVVAGKKVRLEHSNDTRRHFYERQQSGQMGGGRYGGHHSGRY